MSLKLYDEDSVIDIAEAIRIKNGESTQYKIAEMAQAILDIPSGGGSGISWDDIATRNYTGDVVLSDTVTSLIDYAFASSAITLFIGKGVRSLGTYALNGCASLTGVYIGGEITGGIGNYAIRNSSAIKRVCFPNASGGFGFGGYGLQGLSNLELIDNGSENMIQVASLNSSHFTTLILRKSTGIQALYSATVFDNTPFKSGGTGGIIYIPQALYEHLGDGSALDYKSATNWSAYDGYGTITWAQLEGSIYENKYWWEDET